MRGTQHDFYGSVSRYTRNGRERVVGSRRAEVGCVHRGSEGEECRICGLGSERRRFYLANGGAGICGGIEISGWWADPRGYVFVESPGGDFDGWAAGGCSDLV